MFFPFIEMVIMPPWIYWLVFPIDSQTRLPFILHLYVDDKICNAILAAGLLGDATRRIYCVFSSTKSKRHLNVAYVATLGHVQAKRQLALRAGRNELLS